MSATPATSQQPPTFADLIDTEEGWEKRKKAQAQRQPFSLNHSKLLQGREPNLRVRAYGEEARGAFLKRFGDADHEIKTAMSMFDSVVRLSKYS